jgi:hypothetical protein
LSTKTVPVSSSWSRKAGTIGWHREKQGKNEKKTPSSVKAVTRVCARVTTSKSSYQHQNWQTQERRIAEITQPCRRQMLGERRSVEIEASYFFETASPKIGA